jgi:hypothetical protein
LHFLFPWRSPIPRCAELPTEWNFIGLGSKSASFDHFTLNPP